MQEQTSVHVPLFLWMTESVKTPAATGDMRTHSTLVHDLFDGDIGFDTKLELCTTGSVNIEQKSALAFIPLRS